jgi:xylulokinase
VVRALTNVDTMDSITVESYRWPNVTSPVELPDVSEADEIAGKMLTDVAGTMGVAPGTPVGVGTIDCFADVAAAGVSGPGEAAILLGSTLVLYAVTHAGAEVPGLDTSSHLGNGSLVGGSTASAGLALDWLARLLGSTDGLEREATELMPGAGGLLALPYLAGERTPLGDPWARGILAGLTLASTPAQVYRAMLDGVAITALDHHDLLREAGFEPERYRVAGGGVVNTAWLATVCDAVGVPLDVMPDAGSAAGAAWLGLRMLGAEPDRQPIETRQPDEIRHERLHELLEQSRNLWRAAGPVVRGLGTLRSEPGR